ncbi:hypothetical protein B0T19DRAFT_81718 [Cercophora scortea]|uniref:Uncharacterized protein n=1 Tax=Cercophora scortea TaxID=314031 RepID=A0AAE0MN31_9PEZI|nr:hypothetical protein B0T19DRAFT_81718 [Cercophora scortea]
MVGGGFQSCVLFCFLGWIGGWVSTAGKDSEGSLLSRCSSLSFCFCFFPPFFFHAFYILALIIRFLVPSGLALPFACFTNFCYWFLFFFLAWLSFLLMI